ncbi:hypothetical protein [Variovorax sp. OV700]|nr:hypothetical protein [Variovorax sp. OV700]
MDEVDRARSKCSQEVDSSLIGEAKALLAGRSLIASKDDHGAEGNAR